MPTYTIYGYTAHRDVPLVADHDRITADDLPAACAVAARRWPGRITCAYAGSHFAMPRAYWEAVEGYEQNPPPWPADNRERDEGDREPRRSIHCDYSDASALEYGPRG